MNTLPLQVKTHGQLHSRDICVFVGGSGDDRDSFDPIIMVLSKALPKTRFVTFSFRGGEQAVDLPLHAQTSDLREVLRNISGDDARVRLIATSRGAYAAAVCLADPTVSVAIDKCIFIDPADYEIDTAKPISKSKSWSGVDVYNPSSKTASMMLSQINGPAVVDVVHFTLRNYTAQGYVPQSVRGVDNEGATPRLNSTMVRSFFTNTRLKNRGTYLEDQTLPHAFLRDGNKEQNIQTLSAIILRLLK